MKIKYKLKGGILLLLVFALVLNGNPALAATYSANAGMRTADAGVLKDQTGLDMPSGNLVQYIWLRTGIIHGPTDANGTVLTGVEDDRPNPGPGTFTNNWGQAGYDSVTNLFSGTNGKFWHQVGVEAGGQQAFIVRAWNGPTAASATYFGESVVFYSQSNPVNPAANRPLSSFSTIFPKTVPAAPSVTPTPIQGSGASAPQLTLAFDSILGARHYVLEIYRVRTGSAGSYTYSDSAGSYTQYKDSAHTLYQGNEGQVSHTFNLALSDQNTEMYYRVKAVNSFGDSAWDEGSASIPENADPTIPVAITDLSAAYDGTSITLTWSPPYDTDRLGVVAACVSYEVRVSTEALVDLPKSPFNSAQTNPNDLTNWDGAVAIMDYFSPAPTVPAPAVWDGTGGATETVTITGTFTENYYFAVKARDASGNISYISNIAGVALGAGPAVLQIQSNFNLVSTGLGMNTLAVIFDTSKGAVTDAETAAEVCAQATDFTIEKLVTAINTKAGANVVQTIGYWDDALQKQVGLAKVNDPLSTSLATPGDDPATILSHVIGKENEPISVGVSQDVSLSLTGYR